jgi:hypothetical protein
MPLADQLVAYLNARPLPRVEGLLEPQIRDLHLREKPYLYPVFFRGVDSSVQEEVGIDRLLPYNPSRQVLQG